jgi:hypothetical protein
LPAKPERGDRMARKIAKAKKTKKLSEAMKAYWRSRRSAHRRKKR